MSVEFVLIYVCHIVLKCGHSRIVVSFTSGYNYCRVTWSLVNWLMYSKHPQPEESSCVLTVEATTMPDHFRSGNRCDKLLLFSFRK